MKTIENINDLKMQLTTNPTLLQAFKDDPVKTIQDLHEEPIPNTTVYRMVVGALGGSVLLVIIGIVILSLSPKAIEPSVSTLFTAIASGSIGALAGLLAPSPKTR
jgi:hypothetical protein